jgi:SAM-dependent methyltransferase
LCLSPSRSARGWNNSPRLIRARNQVEPYRDQGYTKRGCNDGPVGIFDSASEAYDRARPSYPSGVYDALESHCGPLEAKTVADGGAGTGVATRELIERRAAVIAFDPGPGMLHRAIARSPGLRAVMADAASLPMRSRCLDLITFGQSWHWVDQEAGAREVARVLKDGGWWAAWWNQPWADAEVWFDDYYSLLEARCDGLSRAQRNVDWCVDAIADGGCFQQPTRLTFEWDRRVSVEQWLVDLSSHSYVIGLSEPQRSQLVRDVESLLRDTFVDGSMLVRFQTCLWLAQSDV